MSEPLAWQKLGWDEVLFVYASYNSIDGTFPYWILPPQSLAGSEGGSVRAPDVFATQLGATTKDGLTHYAVGFSSGEYRLCKLRRDTRKVEVSTGNNNIGGSKVFLSPDETKVYLTISNSSSQEYVEYDTSLNYIRQLSWNQTNLPEAPLLIQNTNTIQIAWSPDRTRFFRTFSTIFDDIYSLGIHTQGGLGSNNGSPLEIIEPTKRFAGVAVSRDGSTLFGLEHEKVESDFRSAIWAWQINEENPSLSPLIKKVELENRGGSFVPFLGLAPVPPLKLGACRDGADRVFSSIENNEPRLDALGYKSIGIKEWPPKPPTDKSAGTLLPRAMWFDNSQKLTYAYDFFLGNINAQPFATRFDFKISGFGFSQGVGTVWNETYSNRNANGGRADIFYAVAVKIETSELVFKKSFDKGKAWTPEVVVATLEYGEVFNIIEYSSLELTLVAPSGKMFRSTDCGTTWQDVTPETA